MVDKYEIKTDLRGLIRLLAKNLYARPDVFIRELLQNAHDSILKRRELEDSEAPQGQIKLQTTRSGDKAMVTFEDNGAGLTENEIHEHLSTIGRSGTEEFRQVLLQKGQKDAAANFIGQFGIGLLSAFVVANRVIVETRSCYDSSCGWVWESHGGKDYWLQENDQASIGTTVRLHIDDEYLDVADEDAVRKAIKRYADFLPIPIYLNSLGQVNTVDPPWVCKYESEEERVRAYGRFVSDRFPEDFPLSIIPVSADEPSVKGVLYISDRARPHLSALGRVDLYQTRMFIAADHADILPPWAKFVRGVIDSPALTPTAARDDIQQDDIFMAVRNAVGRTIIDHLKDMSAHDPKEFGLIMDWHHHSIKGMALEADDFFDEVADLLPFETNQGNLSLRDYLEKALRTPDGGRQILYFSEPGLTAQFFLLANARDILVINASYIYEKSFLIKYAERNSSVVLKELDFESAEAILPPLAPEEAERFRPLKNEFDAQTGKAGTVAKVVRFKPTDVPAVVTFTSARRLREEMEYLEDHPVLPESLRDVFRRILKDNPILPATIHLNADNMIIRLLSDMNLRTEVAREAIRAIYNNAVMFSQRRISPTLAQEHARQANHVIQTLITQAQELAEARIALEEQILASSGPSELTNHVSCFMAFDFEKRAQIYDALCEILQDKPYFWEVVRADAYIESQDLLPNLSEKMQRAHCFIVDISDGNPNVLLELGLILTLDRPYILLQAEGSTAAREHWANLGGKMYFSYNDSAEPAQLHEELTRAISHHKRFQALAEFAHPAFLSL